MLSKEYYSNQNESIIIEDLVGNKKNLEIVVDNIDNSILVSKVKYKKESYSTNNILVIIVFNEEVQEIEGWNLSKDKKQLTKVFSISTNEEIEVKDNAGNIKKIEINVIISENKYVPRIISNTGRRMIFF